MPGGWIRQMTSDVNVGHDLPPVALTYPYHTLRHLIQLRPLDQWLKTFRFVRHSHCMDEALVRREVSEGLSVQRAHSHYQRRRGYYAAHFLLEERRGHS